MPGGTNGRKIYRRRAGYFVCDSRACVKGMLVRDFFFLFGKLCFSFDVVSFLPELNTGNWAVVSRI